MNRNLVNIVMYTTNGNEEELRESYEDELEALGYTEDEFSYEEWKMDDNDFRWHDMIDGIKSSKWNTRCVVVGTLGLWDGTHEIIPIVCDDLTQAIRKCMGSSIDVEIVLNNGFIQVTASHHDGTNEFEIHLLNKKGCDLINGNFANSCYYKQIKGYLY